MMVTTGCMRVVEAIDRVELGSVLLGHLRGNPADTLCGPSGLDERGALSGASGIEVLPPYTGCRDDT